MTSRAGRYDVLIVGGGHNGLVCACYLAAAGLRVRVLERRGVVGGAAVTEEFYPGFRNSVASYTVGLLHPKVIRELKLHQHGLRLVERPFANFLPLSERPGDALQVGEDGAATRREFARFAPRDAERLDDYEAMLDGVAGLLRSLLLETPPNVGGGLSDLLRGVGLGKKLRRLSMTQRRDALALFTGSAGDLLEQWFESDAVRALFGFDAIVGSYASPYSAGSGYVLLHHVFGEVNGKRGVWGHAIGGMGAITQAMATQARALGVEISVDAEVAAVDCEHGRAVGVTLADGAAIGARAIAAGLNLKLLYQRLIDPAELDDEFRRRIDAIKCASASFRINVALSELPRFSCAPGDGGALQKLHQSGIIVAPSLSYMENAYFDARRRGWSQRPVIEMLIPSTLDDSLAPPGRHVASLFCQHFDPQLPDGRRWADQRDAAADQIIDTLNHYAPNFRASVLGRQVLSPYDLEQTFGLVGGDIFHGALSLNQLYSARPLLGYGDYRGPLKGLYHCASGAHPGGGVTGVPGHNAAREIIKDLKTRRRSVA